MTSAIRNTEIIFYSNDLETHKNDIGKSWKILKTIIGKKRYNCKQKSSFLIDDSTIADSKVIANEFNNFFVSICRKLSKEIVSTVSPLSYVFLESLPFLIMMFHLNYYLGILIFCPYVS